VQRGYKEHNWGKGVSSVREPVKKLDSWKRAGRKALSREDLNAEAEESSLLEAVAKE
jgi:hypothetical protein